MIWFISGAHYYATEGQYKDILTFELTVVDALCAGHVYSKELSGWQFET